MSLTYYEQAYLARYLGFLLVEGDDLVMRDGRVFVRTIAGLKRCDVIWRHVDADWCDPLELNSSSRIGVPGLLEAIRQGGVAVENMPGTGMVESRAMLAFLPALARRLLGEDLLMPNIATWWCGQTRERERVLDEFDKISIASAFGARASGLQGRTSVIGEELTHERTRALARRDRRARARLCRAGSRAPVDDAALDGGQARAAAVRLARLLRRHPRRLAGDARRILPDFGPARRARRHRWATASSPPTSGCSPRIPSRRRPLCPTPESVRITRLLGNLPSRAADNLFWFGRYLERAEATLRVVRCLSARSVDPDAPMRVGRQSLERLMGVLVGWGAVDAAALAEGATAASNQGLRDPARYGSALSLARSARNAASVIRERLTHQTWELIGRLETHDRSGACSGACRPARSSTSPTRR